MTDDVDADVDARLYRKLHGRWPAGYTPPQSANGPEPPPHPADDTADTLPEPVDWTRLFARAEPDTEWLVDEVWPAGRQVHIFAARKSGKSLLMLWIAACLAAGRDPFTGRSRPRLIVTYLDFEMSEDDLLERLEEMGFTEPDLTGWLFYYLWPSLPAMDTDEGGRALMRLVERDHSAAVVIDTISRAVGGEENSADTFRGFFIFTGMRLKRAGVPVCRLDHEGHETGRSRGSSAKADDVDIVWRLQRTDDGLALEKKFARMSWVPDLVELVRTEPDLGYARTRRSWPAGTAERAADLDLVNAPLDVSRRAARKLLTDAGVVPGRNDLLAKAIAWRQVRDRGGLSP